MQGKYLGMTGWRKITHTPENFSNFVDKDYWPPNSPEFNPLDFCIWDELVQQIKFNQKDP